jgi:hypothetical protein
VLWKAADQKLPYKIPTSVYIDDNPLTAGATTITLDDGSGSYDATDHFEPATSEQPRTVKVEDEYITYTGINVDSTGSQLTGCERGAFGTTAASHVRGTELQQATIYAENDGGTWLDCTGQLADHCLMDLLMFYAEIELDFIQTYDYSITLNGAVGSSDTEITLSSVADLPEQGVLVINDEVIYYNGFSGNDIINVKRGMYRTDKAAHSDADPVLISFVTHALAPWRANLLLKSRFENEKKVDAKVETWRQSTLLDVWVNEDGKLDAKMQAPPLDDTYSDLTEEIVVFGSKRFDRNEKARATRVRCWFNPRKADPKVSGKDVEEDYYELQSYVDLEAENANAYGERVIKRLYAEWLYREEDALWTAGHYWTKYVDGSPIVTIGLELRDDDLKVMDLVQMTFPEVVDADGNEESKFYYIIYKLRKALNYIEFKLEEAGFGDVKFAKIGPPNGVLDVGINDVIQTIDIDLSGTALDFDDLKTSGTRQIYIEDEKISFTAAALVDTSYEVVRLTGVTRGVDGTSNVAHSAGVDVRFLYSAMDDEHRRLYGFIGSTGDPPSGNNLDGDGDLTEETPGYLIW